MTATDKKAAPLPPQSPDVVAVGVTGMLVGIVAWGVLNVPLTRNTALLAVGALLVSAFVYSAGYHRFYAHRTYRARGLLRIFFAIVGAGNFLGSILSWCRLHRAHHAQLNMERDPYNRKRGFFYTWFGSRFVTHPEAVEVDVSDLTQSTIVSLQNSLYPVLSLLVGLGAPAAIASLWGDYMGGLVYAGAARALVFLLGLYTAEAMSHTFGHQPYSDAHTARNNTFIAILTLGEGFMNFHYEFPNDYRTGPFAYHIDATKWVIRLLSFVGLATDLKAHNNAEIARVRLDRQLAEVNAKRAILKWGPAPETLPVWSRKRFDEEIKAGRQLIIMDHIVHDLADFYDDHPGGDEILRTKVGKDATIAFNGGVQRHSKAARNLAEFMRIARMEPAETADIPIVTED